MKLPLVLQIPCRQHGPDLVQGRLPRLHHSPLFRLVVITEQSLCVMDAW